MEWFREDSGMKEIPVGAAEIGEAEIGEAESAEAENMTI